MRNLTIALSSILILLGGCRATEMNSPVQFSVSAGKTTLRDCIIDGMKARRWSLVSEGPGEIVARQNVRGKHRVDVRISYSGNDVSIEYVDSENMKYQKSDSGRETIHKNYNAWVGYLRWEIEQCASFGEE